MTFSKTLVCAKVIKILLFWKSQRGRVSGEGPTDVQRISISKQWWQSNNQSCFMLHAIPMHTQMEHILWLDVNVGKYEFLPIVSENNYLRAISLRGLLIVMFFRGESHRSDEGLTLETSALEFLYDGQFTIRFYSSPTQHHSFYRNSPPYPFNS